MGGVYDPEAEASDFPARDHSRLALVSRTRAMKKIVFANGVFDMLHPGHLALLKFAKSLGQTLVVGLNSDRSVRELKGPGRPIHGQQARKEALEALEFVDQVVVFDEVRTTEIVRKLKPNVIVKGDEYTADQIRLADDVPADVEIVIFPVVKDGKGVKISTTGLIEQAGRGR